MRGNMNRFFLVAVAVALLLFAANVAAQEKSFDKVVKTDGEEMIGKVLEIDAESIKFVYQGESLTYTVKQSEINKIQFASGRVQFFTEVTEEKPSQDSSPGLQDHHNLVAVLPFDYMNSGGNRDDKMGLKVQSDCYTYLRKKAKLFDIQDPATTNALLVKNNIEVNNLIGLTPQEMANLLGVEYVVYGAVTINQTSVSSYSANSYSSKANGSRFTSSNLGSSTSTANFNTNVDLKIYNDQGQSVYSDTHDSFWPSENAYEITLNYLIKRTPLYSK